MRQLLKLISQIGKFRVMAVDFPRVLLFNFLMNSTFADAYGQIDDLGNYVRFALMQDGGRTSLAQIISGIGQLSQYDDEFDFDDPLNSPTFVEFLDTSADASKRNVAIKALSSGFNRDDFVDAVKVNGGSILFTISGDDLATWAAAQDVTVADLTPGEALAYLLSTSVDITTP